MSIIEWIIMGLIAGFVASKIVNRSGEGVIVDILLGIGRAVVGDWLFNVFGKAGVTGSSYGASRVELGGVVSSSHATEAAGRVAGTAAWRPQAARAAGGVTGVTTLKRRV